MCQGAQQRVLDARYMHLIQPLDLSFSVKRLKLTWVIFSLRQHMKNKLGKYCVVCTSVILTFVHMAYKLFLEVQFSTCT